MHNHNVWQLCEQAFRQPGKPSDEIRAVHALLPWVLLDVNVGGRENLSLSANMMVIPLGGANGSGTCLA